MCLHVGGREIEGLLLLSIGVAVHIDIAFLSLLRLGRTGASRAVAIAGSPDGSLLIITAAFANAVL